MAGGSPLLGAGPILSSFAKKNGMRTRIIAKRVVGKVIEWDGKEGWIEPSEEIENPESREDIKLVALKAEDVLPPGTYLEENAQVSFFIFTDSYMNNKVFGAERCMRYRGVDVVTQVTPRSKEIKAAKDAKAQGGAVVKNNFNKKPQGSQTHEFEDAMAWMWGGMGGKGDMFAFMNSMGMGRKGGGKGGFRRGNPDLPRERVTSEPIVGTVLRWGGKYGFVKPDIPFEHPAANGEIYVNKKDISDGTPSVGKAIAFHVYCDASGLGAEECIISS